MILDTSFLIDLLRGNPAAVNTARRLEAGGISLRLSPAAWFELHEGVARADRTDDERWRVEALGDVLLVAALTAEHAARGGAVSGRLARQGMIVGDIDALLAGQALSLDEPILTRNAEHFRRMDGVRIETY